MRVCLIEIDVIVYFSRCNFVMLLFNINFVACLKKKFYYVNYYIGWVTLYFICLVGHDVLNLSLHCLKKFTFLSLPNCRSFIYITSVLYFYCIYDNI